MKETIYTVKQIEDVTEFILGEVWFDRHGKFIHANMNETTFGREHGIDDINEIRKFLDIIEAYIKENIKS